VDRVFVFGGHHSPQCRLNDTWFFEVKTGVWRRIGNEKDNTENLESTIGAPSPRANSSAVVYEGKIYVFGGHGGLSYSRVAFNDLYCFDLETETWEKIVPNNNPPEGRGGHSTFASEGKIFVYGGWNSEMQFNNVMQYDLEKKEWYDPDCMHEVHRWNQSCYLVPAIPTWKFFIFGGE
jgi:dynein heavy chain